MSGRGRLRVHSAPQGASRRTWGLDTIFPPTNMTSHPIPSPSDRPSKESTIPFVCISFVGIPWSDRHKCPFDVNPMRLFS